ncbi:gamma carbonic anhydrase family protein [Microbacterium sp. ASV49]|uniref:Gamma carbonic anhydrase family protein n=1 Tax=Microbacterium candidum TaxID=3041922 RepID=A0ABT7MXY1_9MICO|nr:gamma carbonic anhydrase family protein [Microbacterium sp. ASV49]MDL9979317.1 gamma carbonic anhydrase family protein [Microbacterium sp. ASV49]
MPAYEIDGVVPVVHPDAFVHDTASLIGDVVIGADCYIGPFASLRGDFGRITVGEGSNVQDSCVIHAFPGADAILEPSSHVGHGAVLHGCIIRSYALIGIGATILDGAEVGEDALVGAGAVVTAGTVIPPGVLVLGSPARVIKELDEETRAWKRNGVEVYRDLARRSRETLRQVTPLTAVEADRRRVSTGAGVAKPLHETRR